MPKTVVPFACFTLFALVGAAGVHRVSLTAVDDETGRPVAGLQAGVLFDNTVPFSPDERWLERLGETDDDGVFSAVGVTSRGRISFGVADSAEYYGQREDRRVNALDAFVSRTFRLRRRHPTRLIETVVCLRHEFTNDYSLSTCCRFDFLRRSFLPPYGTGTVADVEMRVVEIGRPLSRFEDIPHRYEVRFPGAGNGGVLREIRPDTTFAFDRIDERELTNRFDAASCRNRRLGFRIRTRYDADGRLVGAHYGYIVDASVLIRLHLRIRASRAPKRTCNCLFAGFTCRLNPVACENNLECHGEPAERYDADTLILLGKEGE